MTHNSVSEGRCCPISREPLVDPVLASDGHVYDWSSLVSLCRSSTTLWPPHSPMTREILRGVVIPMTLSSTLSASDLTLATYSGPRRLYCGADLTQWKQPLCMSSTPSSLYDLPPSWWRDVLFRAGGMKGRDDSVDVIDMSISLQIWLDSRGSLLRVLAPDNDTDFEVAARDILTAFGFESWLTKAKDGSAAQAAFSASFIITKRGKTSALSLEAILAQHTRLGIVI